MLADFIQDNGAFGAESVVISNASSKTAYGTAFLLDGLHRIGLTSARNRDFTASLGCYEQVLTYDEIAELPQAATVFVDVAGDAAVRRAVHERVEPVHSAVVVADGPEGLRADWLAVLAGSTPPRSGLVIQL